MTTAIYHEQQQTEAKKHADHVSPTTDDSVFCYPFTGLKKDFSRQKNGSSNQGRC
jgi:hypothetical protein